MSDLVFKKTFTQDFPFWKFDLDRTLIWNTPREGGRVERPTRRPSRRHHNRFPVEGGATKGPLIRGGGYGGEAAPSVGIDGCKRRSFEGIKHMHNNKNPDA